MSQKDEEKEIVEWLKKSKEQKGELNPVIMTPDGIVVDGKHRLRAYPGWKVQIVNLSKKEALRERIHRNIHRRVPKKERQAQILEYALHLEDEGVKPEDMILALRKDIPFSENYIRQLLPAKYKKVQMAREQKMRDSVTQMAKKVVPEKPFLEGVEAPCLSCAKSESCDRTKFYASAAEPGKLVCDEYVETSEPAVPKPSAVEKPSPESEPVAPAERLAKARAVGVPGTVVCPHCHVPVAVVMCSNCWRDMKVKDVFKMVREGLGGVMDQIKEIFDHE